MTKTISIYAAQVLLGIIALATGYAKITGTGMMVQQFYALGIGPGFLFVAGCAEIAAGLCLLLPRGGILGAVLLTSVMVGALGHMMFSLSLGGTFMVVYGSYLKAEESAAAPAISTTTS